MLEKSITIEDLQPQDVYGANNLFLNQIKNKHPKLKIVARGNELKAIGEEQEVENFTNRFELFLKLIDKGRELNDSLVNEVFGIESSDSISTSTSLSNDNDANIILYGNNGKPIRARTVNQIKLVNEIATNDIVFALGPAGTGKTYTAVAVAVKALKNKEIKRIILTRPAVEAGESLGFLPGDLKEKIDPYLRPLYDALFDMIPAEKLARHMENGEIEVAPLAFMRGRTFSNAFVILDEAQNTTATQMKMFLTRMGENSRMVATGDLSQTDLPKDVKSGLGDAVRKLEGIEGIGMIRFSDNDVVRHNLAAKIIKAYDEWDRKKKMSSNRQQIDDDGK